MKKLALLLAILMAVCSFSAISVVADGLFVSAGTTTLPEEGGADSMLIGWTYKDGANTVVLAPGASFTAESDVTLEPLYLDMDMISGVSVRTATPAGLRFTTNISEPQYQALLATGVDFELGTIIAPTDFITGEFTYEALDNAGKSCLKIPCKIFWGYTEEIRTYTGVISNLYEENYNRDFSARAYVSVTYTDGTEKIFYSAYNKDENSRSAYAISCAALSDTYSELSDAAKAVLQGYFDSVGVDISYVKPVIGNSPSGVTSNITNGYYTVKWEWMCQYEDGVPTLFQKNKGYQITMTVTAKGGLKFTDNTAILVNGKPPKAGGYTIDGSVMTIIKRHPLGDYTWGYDVSGK